MTTKQTATSAFIATLLLAIGSGCSSVTKAGRIDLSSQGTRPRAFEHTLVEGVYAVEESQSSFWFSDIPLETLSSEPGTAPPDSVFTHVQLLWSPEPGRTPLSDSATNAVVRVVIVSKGEVGLYGGAAFAEHSGTIGADEVDLELRGGTLTLLTSTAGFIDPLTPAGFAAELRARRSGEQAKAWRRAVSQIVTNATGRSTWVRSPSAIDARAVISLARDHAR